MVVVQIPYGYIGVPLRDAGILCHLGADQF